MKLFRLFFLLFSAAIFALSAASFFSSVFADGAEAGPVPASAPASEGVPADEAYVIRREGDAVAVFSAGEDAPLGFIDVCINDLPESDRAMLETGLFAPDGAQLASIIEDYTG